MKPDGTPIDVLLIGGGMITRDQLLPSLFQLRREGLIGSITVCARSRGTIERLGSDPIWEQAFPDQEFIGIPSAESIAQPARKEAVPREALAGMKPGDLAVIATPEETHFALVMAALEAGLHVTCVKPLVLKAAEAMKIARRAGELGLFVGIEYHKRFDRRALIARMEYRAGRLGIFRIGEARMVEPWGYRNSNFQNWFYPEASDPFAYVGCHYVDQVYFMTGLRPTAVSVVGVPGKFPNGREAFMWASGRVIFENGAILNLINGLGYPDDGAGSNDQGITMFCEDGQSGALIAHNDQFRGVSHSFGRESAKGKLFNFVNPDYFKLVAWPGPGMRPIGYGHDSVAALASAAVGINEAAGGLSGPPALAARQRALREIDAAGFIATPTNSLINELAIEAGRLSIAAEGRTFKIEYEPAPRVVG